MNNGRIAGILIFLLAFAPLVFSQNQSTQQTAGTQSAPPLTKAASQAEGWLLCRFTHPRIAERPMLGRPLEYVRISLDGNWALVKRAGAESGVQLYSLKTGSKTASR